ncbi:hypothetical protein BDW62DRAFT_206990 [Aspergillus aurantiobrunneus]
MATQQISGISATDGARIFAGTNTTTNITIGDAPNLLPYATQAPFNAYGRENEALCHPDTRLEILDCIRTWRDGDDDRSIFWLTGWAGTGKSTIARTVAREVYDSQYWTASFFFSRGGGDVAHGKKFVSTIALQLTSNYAELRTLLQKAVYKDHGIAHRILTDQWRDLVAHPISQLDSSVARSPLVVVVDALDECENENDVSQILQLLTDPWVSDQIRFRVLITGRPELHIRDGLLRLPDNSYREIVLHDMSEFTVDRDISIFLRHGLARQGIKDHLVDQLVAKSAGLFVWAATACRFIVHGRKFAARRLDMLLQDSENGTAPQLQLDRIYLTVLMQSLSAEYTDKEKEELCDLLRYILGSVAVLLDPLSTCSLSSLLGLPEDEVYLTLEGLHSIIDVPQDTARPLRLHHPSFRDFLLDKSRCGQPSFWVDEQEAHRMLFTRCIELIFSNLYQGICGVNMPGTSISQELKEKTEQRLLPEVQYACLYWPRHLIKARRSDKDHQLVQRFLETHFLHWIEALAWMRKISEAISSVTALEFLTFPDNYAQLSSYIRDMKRFLRFNSSVIEHFPLQLYASAVVFAPVKSRVRNKFRASALQLVKQLPVIEEDWSPLLQTLEGHKARISAIACSHDGQLLASGSNDSKIQVWDVSNGMLIRTLEKHDHTVYDLAFSYDDKTLLSASVDSTIRLWDMSTGHCLHTFTEEFAHWGETKSFSPDGKMLASQVNCSSVVEVWNVLDRQHLYSLDGHYGRVDCIMFSPDGRTLATTSRDDTLRLWDPESGECLHLLRGPSLCVKNLAFSDDGRFMASSTGGDLKVWNVSDGQCLHENDGYSGVSHLAFSPSGNSIAFAKRSSEIAIWSLSDNRTLECRVANRGAFVEDLTFSPDGKVLASASNDHIIRLWDPNTALCCAVLRGHIDGVNAVIFCCNGETLASASDDHSVRLWDPRVTQSSESQSHTDRVNAMAVSLNGQLLASASDDKTLRLWSLTTKEPLHILSEHRTGVTMVCFSSDSELLASATKFSSDNIRNWDGRIIIWDASRGQCRQILAGHSHYITSITFGPDNKSLASSSTDGTLRIWKIRKKRKWGLSKNDALLKLNPEPTSNFKPTVQEVSYSKSGNMFAAGACLVHKFSPRDETYVVNVWDVTSGRILHVLTGHTDKINAVAFGPDEGTIASASSDMSIRLWELSTGKCLKSFQGHTMDIHKVCFSEDGQMLASLAKRWGSTRDGGMLWGRQHDQICIWTLQSESPLQIIDRFHSITSLSSFTQDNRALITDRGVLAIQPTSQPPSPTNDQRVDGIFVENEWITKNGQRMLWLPAEYRAATTTAVYGNTVVLGYKTGRVVFLEFR